MFKVKLFRFLLWVQFFTRWYTFKSRVHRLVHCKTPKNLKPLPLCRDFSEIQKPYLEEMKWRPDGGILRDAFCKAEYVWFKYLTDPNKLVGDCDEFASFIDKIIQNSIKAGIWKEGQITHCILGVFWINPKGQFEGHSVCYFMSHGKYGYQDYDQAHTFGTFKELISDIINKYAENSQFASWHKMTTDLRTISYSVAAL